LESPLELLIEEFPAGLSATQEKIVTKSKTRNRQAVKKAIFTGGGLTPDLHILFLLLIALSILPHEKKIAMGDPKNKDNYPFI
jgi:hypothetical protein